ncbi:MAG: GNAT family N-acetyltransferase, partial [Chloroflexota bacterium]|nr:GNAT family N-acetyltransferase [Chloroflexota bacterium]
IGELLLHSALSKSIREKRDSLTLEVRISNIPAIRLYEKYGLTFRGYRKHYYRDNGEDASIMTVDNLQSADYHLLIEKNLTLLSGKLKNYY